MLRGAPFVMATLAICLPVAMALMVAWKGYPPAFAHRLSELRMASFGRLVVALVIVIGLVWMAGRPLTGGLRAGILWAHPGSYNNVRPWIDPILVLWGAHGDGQSVNTVPDTSPL